MYCLQHRNKDYFIRHLFDDVKRDYNLLKSKVKENDNKDRDSDVKANDGVLYTS